MYYVEMKIALGRTINMYVFGMHIVWLVWQCKATSYKHRFAHAWLGCWNKTVLHRSIYALAPDHKFPLADLKHTQDWRGKTT